MANISKIIIKETTYDIRDSEARAELANITLASVDTCMSIISELT